MPRPIRPVHRGALLFFFSVALGAGVIQRAWPHIQASPPTPGQLKGFASVDSNLGSAISVLDQGMSFLFSNFDPVSNPGDPPVVSQTQTFTIPVDSGAKASTHLLLQLDCSVHIRGNCSATLIIQAGGKTRVVDLLEELLVSRSTTAIEDFVGGAPSKTTEPSESGGASTPPGNEQLPEFREVHDPFFFEFAYSVPPNSQNPITVTVLIERDDGETDGWGYVPIYSLLLVVIDPQDAPAVSAEPRSGR
jgi:hypothetical protein